MKIMSVLQRVPWLWHDMIATRVKLPIWLQATLLFCVLYAACAAAAFYAGVILEFLGDHNWSITLGLIAFSAYVMGKTPLGVEKIWSSITPWLANTNQEIAVFHEQTRKTLMRMFWPIALVLILVTLPFSFLTPSAQEGSAYELFDSRLNTALIPLVMYFLGGASALCTFGICAFTWRMNRDLVLKTGFIFKEGKKSLAPFNTLLWQIWGTFSIPLIAGVILLEYVTPGKKGDWLSIFNVITFGVILILTLPTILLPQHSMNKWLRKLQQNELDELNKQLERAAEPITNGDTHELLLRMHRYTHIDHQIRRAIAFSPTLVDLNFVIEIGSRVFFIVIAMLLRNLFYAQQTTLP
jgi:hypothetical protein